MVGIRIAVVSVVSISKMTVSVVSISIGFRLGHSGGGEQAQGNDSSVLHHFCDFFASL